MDYLHVLIRMNDEGRGMNVMVERMAAAMNRVRSRVFVNESDGNNIPDQQQQQQHLPLKLRWKVS